MTARRLVPVLLACTALSLLAGLMLGAAPISLPSILSSLFRLGAAQEWQDVVIWEMRMPRVLVAWLIGAALSASGCALQALFANPLADPSVLGVASAAALGVVIAIHGGIASRVSWAVPLAACSAAGVATLLVWQLAGRRGRVEITTILLAGVAVGQIALAGTALVVSFALSDHQIARRLLSWLLGGVEARSWMHVLWGAGPIAAGVAWLYADARNLDALLLEETHAVAVGLDLRAVRRRLILWTSVLTGASVAIGGVVGFVGLVVPHALRPFVGAGHRALLPAAVITGGGFVVLADVAARRLIAPEELQLGVVTGAVGAPLFLYLLARRRAEQSP